MYSLSLRGVLRLTLTLLALVLPAGSAAAASESALERPRPALPADGLTAALRAGKISEAEYALYRALAIFDRRNVVNRFGWVAKAEPRDATPALRDLASRFRELDEEGRTEAVRILRRPILARPDHPGTGSDDPVFYDNAPPDPAIYPYECRRVCVSWVTVGRDAPPSYDYVRTVLSVLDRVWASVVTDQGFRPPKSDLNTANAYFNPDARLDVYLLDIVGKAGIYGYCSTDDPNVLGASAGYGGRDASAYCVLDNDYAEFGEGRLAVLQATAAHEFFHAIQFAYNFDQDSWLMESTATWMEDEVFDNINDNYQYVGASQVIDPYVPLDIDFPTSGVYSGFKYGAYTFFQLLTENYGRSLMRDTWESSDAAPGRPARHSLLALEDALGDQRIEVSHFYHQYAIANYWPPAFYQEGDQWVVHDIGGNPLQLSAPYERIFTLSKAKPQTRVMASRLDHLTYTHVAFRPGKGLARNAKLVVNVTASRYGSEASVLTVSQNGTIRVRPIPLRNGRGELTLRGFARVMEAVLVLSNGSTRTDYCGSDQTDPVFACFGLPSDDSSSFRYQARLQQAA